MTSLPSPTDCCSSTCEDALVQNIPGPMGPAGADGSDGTDGVNSFTSTSANFTQPAADANVIVTVADSTWITVGQDVFIETGGYYEVISKSDATHVTVKNYGYDENAAPAATIASGAHFGPSGLRGIAGNIDTGGALLAVNNLDDLDNVVTARTNLGLGTMAVATATDYLAKAGNLSGLANTATSRTNLGVAIGTNVQAYNALLAVIAALAPTVADRLIYTTGVNTVAVSTLTSFARTLLDDATAAAARATMGNLLPRYGLLGSLTAVDLNTTNTDSSIVIEATRYRIDKVTVDNASISLTTSTAALFTAPAAGGVTLAAAQALSALTAATKYKDLTLEAVVGTDVVVATTIYFRTAVAQGAAATANVWVWGWVLQ